MQDKVECVKVAVRCRPLNPNEVNNKQKNIIQVDEDRGEIIIQHSKNNQPNRVFTYDMVFGFYCQQEHIFRHAALPIIQSVLQGYNGTIFAYGQTGTGKTHTMQGNKDDEKQRGLIPRTFDHIIKSIGGTPNVNFLVKVSMLEIYNEEIADLLVTNSTNKLQIHQNKDKGVYVNGLNLQTVTNVADMRRFLKIGCNNRHTGSTQMNRDSSRSHSIFVIRIEQQTEIQGESHIRVGKLNLVDLAGSERQKKTQTTGSRSKEGIYINLSLSTLGKVIGALTSSKPQHVPYRDSKLTRLLQESLGGNSKTVMIANIGPACSNFEQSLSTLRYASQAKKIKVKPRINEDPKDAMIREYQEQIQKLKLQLEGKLPLDGLDGKGERKSTIRDKFNKEKEQLERENHQILSTQLQKKKELENRKLSAEQQYMQEKEKQDKLASQLKEMKKKCIRGDKLKEEARLHEKEIFEAEQELQERKQRERRLEEELSQKNVEVEDIQGKNLTLKEQVQQHRKQLTKLNSRLKAKYQQHNNIQEFMNQELQDLQDQNRTIFKELKLLNLIIENFVPIKELQSIQDRLEYNEDIGDWEVIQNRKTPKPNPGSVYGFKIPLVASVKQAVAYGEQNPRYRDQNISVMQVNVVQTTTQNFTGQMISQNVLQNLSVVLNNNQEEQKEIALEEKPNVYIDDLQRMNKEQVMRNHQNSNRAKSAKKMRVPSARRKK